MRPVLTVILCASLAAGAAVADDAIAWGYRVGAAHPPRQGSFCDDADSALEIATLFERFGPRTGFSALADSADCTTRVHAVTPERLIRQVRVALDGGGAYHVNFIQVQAGDGSRPVLVTTRRLTEQ